MLKWITAKVSEQGEPEDDGGSVKSAVRPIDIKLDQENLPDCWSGVCSAENSL